MELSTKWAKICPLENVTLLCYLREIIRKYTRIEGGTYYFDVRDWSLIVRRAGGYKIRRGTREVLPLRKVGAEKDLAMLKGGGDKKVLG